MTYAEFRRTKVSRRRVRKYVEKTGREPSDKQLIYWGRGYLRDRDVELVYARRPTRGKWEHTIVWRGGWFRGTYYDAGRYVRHTPRKDDLNAREMKRLAEEAGHIVGYIGDEQQWGAYAVEQI